MPRYTYGMRHDPTGPVDLPTDYLRYSGEEPDSDSPYEYGTIQFARLLTADECERCKLELIGWHDTTAPLARP